MSLQELKANAYDAIVQIELWKQKLNEAQQTIANWKEPEPINIKKDGSDVDTTRDATDYQRGNDTY